MSTGAATAAAAPAPPAAIRYTAPSAAVNSGAAATSTAPTTRPVTLEELNVELTKLKAEAVLAPTIRAIYSKFRSWLKHSRVSDDLFVEMLKAITTKLKSEASGPSPSNGNGSVELEIKSPIEHASATPVASAPAQQQSASTLIATPVATASADVAAPVVVVAPVPAVTPVAAIPPSLTVATAPAPTPAPALAHPLAVSPPVSAGPTASAASGASKLKEVSASNSGDSDRSACDRQKEQEKRSGLTCNTVRLLELLSELPPRYWSLETANARLCGLIDVMYDAGQYCILPVLLKKIKSFSPDRFLPKPGTQPTPISFHLVCHCIHDPNEWKKAFMEDGRIRLRPFRSEHGYYGLPLIWFGIQSKDPDNSALSSSKGKKAFLTDASLYGTVRISIPLKWLLDQFSHRYTLGTRAYGSEHSHSVLLSPSAVTIIGSPNPRHPVGSASKFPDVLFRELSDSERQEIKHGIDVYTDMRSNAKTIFNSLALPEYRDLNDTHTWGGTRISHPSTNDPKVIKPWDHPEVVVYPGPNEEYLYLPMEQVRLEFVKHQNSGCPKKAPPTKPNELSNCAPTFDSPKKGRDRFVEELGSERVIALQRQLGDRLKDSDKLTVVVAKHRTATSSSSSAAAAATAAAPPTGINTTPT